MPATVQSTAGNLRALSEATSCTQTLKRLCDDAKAAGVGNCLVCISQHHRYAVAANCGDSEEGAFCGDDSTSLGRVAATPSPAPPAPPPANNGATLVGGSTTIVTEKSAVIRMQPIVDGSARGPMNGSDPCHSNLTHAHADPCNIQKNCTVLHSYPQPFCPPNWKMVTNWTSVEVGGCYGAGAGGGYDNDQKILATNCVYNCKTFAACAPVYIM
jgi:hypothetical protein